MTICMRCNQRIDLGKDHDCQEDLNLSDWQEEHGGYTTRKLSRQEFLEGLADQGVDTWEDYEDLR